MHFVSVRPAEERDLVFRAKDQPAVSDIVSPRIRKKNKKRIECVYSSVFFVPKMDKYLPVHD